MISWVPLKSNWLGLTQFSWLEVVEETGQLIAPIVYSPNALVSMTQILHLTFKLEIFD